MNRVKIMKDNIMYKISSIILLTIVFFQYASATCLKYYGSGPVYLGEFCQCSNWFFLPSDVTSVYVDYGGQWVYWYNSDNEYLFVSKSSGTVFMSDGANNGYISC